MSLKTSLVILNSLYEFESHGSGAFLSFQLPTTQDKCKMVPAVTREVFTFLKRRINQPLFDTQNT